MEEDDIFGALLTDKIDIAFTAMSDELKQHRSLKVSPLFEETFHVYVPKDDPITMATNPPLVQFSNKSIYELYPLPTKIRQALVKQPKHLYKRSHILN